MKNFYNYLEKIIDLKSFIKSDQDLSSDSKNYNKLLKKDNDNNQPLLFKNDKKIKKKYKGTILYLHGFPDNTELEITIPLEKLGFKVKNPKILWGKAFKENKKLLMKYLIKQAKNSDVIIGSSFGGYIAFLLTGLTKTPCILINPVINIKTIIEKTGPEHVIPSLHFFDKKNKEEYDNNITKITSHFIDEEEFNNIIKNYPSGNEIFFGGGDTLLPPSKTKQELQDFKISNKFKNFTIKNMGHGRNQSVRHDEPALSNDMQLNDIEWGAYDYFPRILEQSNIIGSLL
jgi:predicted esterase YcpF (UPF0227 family)